MPNIRGWVGRVVVPQTAYHHSMRASAAADLCPLWTYMGVLAAVRALLYRPHMYIGTEHLTCSAIPCSHRLGRTRFKPDL